MRFCPFYHLARASPLPLDMGYLFLVGSNILPSTTAQQWVAVLEFSQEKMSACPYTLPSYATNAPRCQKSPSPRWSFPHCDPIWRWRSNSRQRNSSSTEGQEGESQRQGLRGLTMLDASPGMVPPTAGNPAETKFSKPAFNSMWIVNFQMFKLDLEKAEEPEIKLPTSIGSLKKQENSRKKTSTSALLTTPKPLTVWITTNRGKFLKRWEYQTTWSASWEICMQVKKQQLELDMGQQTGSKSGKEYVKAVYCHLAYLTYMQSTSCEMPD